MANKKVTKKVQSHGKDETAVEAGTVPRTIDQILGDTGTWAYPGVTNAADYESGLRMMPFSDLMRHAANHGLVPIDDKNRLIKTLVGKFKEHWNSYNFSGPTSKAPTAISKEIAAILAQGR